jgi:hypothetical protein
MTTKMNVSRKVYSNVEVMNWLKNIQGFKDNTFPQEWVDEMKCVTYDEWCGIWVDGRNLKRSDYLVPYIDFKRLLKDEYYNAKDKDQVLFCIGYDCVGDLRTFQNPDEDDEIEYVCSMPFYKQTCRDCGDEECEDGWWKHGEFVCVDCWEEQDPDEEDEIYREVRKELAEEDYELINDNDEKGIETDPKIEVRHANWLLEKEDDDETRQIVEERIRKMKEDE